MSQNFKCMGKFSYHDWNCGAFCVRCRAPRPGRSGETVSDPYVDGYNAFRLGMGKNTHAAGTEKYELWARGWQDAEAETTQGKQLEGVS